MISFSINALEKEEHEVNGEWQGMKISGKVGEVERFKYLVSVLQKDCGFGKDIKYNIKCSTYFTYFHKIEI